MPRPFISVLIDTYNHEQFIEQAIVSVVEQDFPASEMEILVVDDGSTDSTPGLVRKFAPRVRCLQKANGGQASAFNCGIPETCGAIVAFLDGDDWWAKHKLRTVVETLEKNPDVGAVGHGYYQVAQDAQSTRVIAERTYRLVFADAEAVRVFPYLRCFLGTSRFTARRQLLERILPVPEELVVEADEFMFTMAVALGGAVVLDQPLFYYRLHPGNLYQFQSQDPTSNRRKYNASAALLRTLPPRLAAAGVSREAVEALVEPIWVDAERIRLGLDGGRPWRTFAVERAAFRLGYREASVGYRLFKAGVLGLTLCLPPRQFYRLRHWYAARGLRQLRRLVGEPVPAAPVLEERIDA